MSSRNGEQTTDLWLPSGVSLDTGPNDPYSANLTLLVVSDGPDAKLSAYANLWSAADLPDGTTITLGSETSLDIVNLNSTATSLAGAITAAEARFGRR